MSKRDLILDAMEELLRSGKGSSCSVSDIARQAGIAKGGMYYYFRSKEEVFDALVERAYSQHIHLCAEAVTQCGGNALCKLETLYRSYLGAFSHSGMDEYLHQSQNADIHQRSLAKILLSLSPVAASIIKQGVSEGLFDCAHPAQFSEIVLSVFCFLLDPGIFFWSNRELGLKLIALADFMEKSLHAPAGSMAFFYAQTP